MPGAAAGAQAPAPDEDPEAEGYTRFDVAVRIGVDPREEPVRAVRLVVGFH